MKPLLKDPSAQRRVDSDGFVVARLFSEPQLERLRASYDRFVGDTEVSGLYESSRHKPYDVNRSITDAIHDEVVLAAGDLFHPSTIYGGSFMVKSHKDSEVLPLHQDWSVVEEDRYATLFIWCPLADATVLNGGLFVLPGSHRYFDTLRSGTYASNRYVLPPELHRRVVDVPLRAGEAILYRDALFHGSHANNGSQERVVVTARVVEEGARLVYYHRASETEVDVYQASPEFYLTHIDSLARGLMPAGVPKLYRRPYRHVPVTDESLQAGIRQHCEVRREANPMKELFRDAALQRSFETNGFVVIDLIDGGQVEALRAFYGGLRNAATPEHGFQVSLDNESPEFVRTVSERLIETVRSSVDRHFQDHRIFTASFVTKDKNPLGVVPPHQDWTFVDETRYWSATIWCPLVDVTVENGALGLVKGSHRLYDHVRPSPSPQYAPPFKDQLFAIFPYLTIVPLRAGQAIVFNNQTLHASPPNATAQMRIAFGIGITHREASLRHYYMLPEQSTPLMEGYEVDLDFFFSYNNARLAALYEQGQKPRGLNSIGTFAVRSRHYKTEELIAAMRAAGNTEDPALAARVAGLYGSMGAGMAGGSPVARKAAQKRVDTRPLWKIYTPANIVREISYRLRKH
jgi:ectoine hydroxylase-related dioxygenase (phytanoyl-CoA dioxygenase family)